MNIHEALQLADNAEIQSVGPVTIKKVLDSKTAKNGKKHRGVFITDATGETLIRVWEDVDNGLLREGNLVQFSANGGKVTVNEWNDKKNLDYRGGEINRIDGEPSGSQQEATASAPSQPDLRALSMEEWAEYEAVLASCSIKATERFAEVWEEALGTDASTELRLRLAANASQSASKAWTGTKYLQRKSK